MFELRGQLTNRQSSGPGNGLSFVRYAAADLQIFVGSHQAAIRVQESITQFIENRMKLKVNREKERDKTLLRGKLFRPQPANWTFDIGSS
jgi:hypothetical protein